MDVDDRALDDTLPRTLELPTGARLVVRELEPGDLPALERLYDRLDPEAVYRRFFTAMPPRHEFFERLGTVAQRGGCGVVVVDPSAPPADAIVAEADAERTGADEGELAITVDRRWRGWLGPYLLDALCREAARRGMRTLRADILTCNRPMRALTRRRGEAYLPESDWQTVRVVIATDGPAPSWPTGGSSTGPKALVELRSMSFDALAELAAAGFDTRACTGRQAGSPGCPLLDGEGECPLAAGADVVVVAVPEGSDRLVAAHRERHPEVPVVVVDRSGGPLRGADLVSAAERGVIEGRHRRAAEHDQGPNGTGADGRAGV